MRFKSQSRSIIPNGPVFRWVPGAGAWHSWSAILARLGGRLAGLFRHALAIGRRGGLMIGRRRDGAKTQPAPPNSHHPFPSAGKASLLASPLAFSNLIPPGPSTLTPYGPDAPE